MKISGFSFARNATKLYYPIKEAIQSILPICDEFVIAIGKGDPDDTTLEEVKSINDPKVKIIETVWDEKYMTHGIIHSQQTNVALKECTGDWCFYVQADEVVHEKYLPVIKNRCEELLDDKEVEGLLFRYKHFWGDYDHYIVSHAWYPNEVRIIRNGIGVESWKSAQSFRLNGRKLNVARVDAEIFHYGWVRPPHLMQTKTKYFYFSHWGTKKSEEYFKTQPKEFDYGPLNRVNKYEGTYPEVMKERIQKMDWKDKLTYEGKVGIFSPNKARHDRIKYRVVTWIEQNLMGGRQLFGYKNYNLLKNK
ncbi:MAG: hypothetical protein Kow00108_24480 [Calditrichia bacterium]